MRKGQGKKQNKGRRIYLDYAATTPVDARVLKAMLPYFSEKFGNSSSLHDFGQEAKQALEKSRAVIAKALRAEPREIIFTSSATESNNLVFKGLLLASQEGKRHIVTSSIEHDCVLNSIKWLEKIGLKGFKVTKLPIDKYGLISLKDLKASIRNDTLLVSIIHANNEIGTIQPIGEIGQICGQRGAYFHVDAAQSFGKIPLNVKQMKIDLLTASSHKMYGPKGVALLYVKKGVKIEPILHGGGHESGLRSSSVNVSAIVGFAKSVEICQKEMKKENQRLTRLRDKLIKEVLKTIPDSYLNGHSQKRLANNANFRFDFVEGESIVLALDSYGIAASTGSACASDHLEPSHVLLSLGLKPEQAHGSLRLTLGRQTTEKEIDYVLEVLPQVIKNLREISPFKAKNK